MSGGAARQLWWLVALLPAVLLGACSAPSPPAPTPVDVTAVRVATPTPVAVAAVAPQSAPQAIVPIPTLRPNALASPVPLPLSIVAGRSGADVRVALDSLLQEQVYLVAAAMDASSNGRLDELIGASSALDQNSRAIAQLIGAVKGQATAQALADAWRAQAADLVQLARPQPDPSVAADLERQGSAIAALVALDQLSASAAEDLLRQRVAAFRAVADAVAGRDPVAAAAQVQATVLGSDALARPLSAAISATVPAQAPAPSEGLDIDLRLAIARDLLARVYVVGAAAAAAGDGRAADLSAQSSTVDQTVDDLGKQLTSEWSDDITRSVAERLRAESAALISIASGGDRRAAAATVDRVRSELDNVLAAANPLLPPGLLAQQLRASDQPLLTAADAFAARDYLNGYTRLREAARQTTKPATTLALSMVDSHPARYLALPTPSPND